MIAAKHFSLPRRIPFKFSLSRLAPPMADARTPNHPKPGAPVYDKQRLLLSYPNRFAVNFVRFSTGKWFGQNFFSDLPTGHNLVV